MTSAWFAAIVTAAGLIAGWFVLSYQRLTEKITEERRTVYGELLAAADTVRSQKPADTTQTTDLLKELSRWRARAEVVSTEEMYRSGLIERLTTAARGRPDGGWSGHDDWTAARNAYLTAARFEGQKNSHVFRRFLRTKVYT